MDSGENRFFEKTQTLNTMLHQVLNQALVTVSADAGSLMQVDHKLGILQIKARLGRPRPGRLTEPVFRIDERSAAALSVRERRSYLCEDVENDPNVAPSRSGINFRSLLVVPVLQEDRVIAIINADSHRARHFTDRDRERLEALAVQVAPAIAERINALEAVAELAFSLSRLPEQGGVKPVLDRIAELAVQSLGADVVTVYQYDQQRGEFTVPDTPLTMAGSFRHERAMREKIRPGDVPWTVVKDRRSGFYPSVQEVPFLTQDAKTDARQRPRFVEREGIQSMAALLLPSRAAEQPAEEVVGVMFVNYRQHHAFNIDEVAALASFADYAAVAILNARREEHRRADQMRMVETMLANFAHRMGNLGGTTRVAGQILKTRLTPGDDVGERQVDLLERKARALLELADRLVRPFKKTGRMFELAPLDLATAISAGTEDLRPELAQVTLKQDIPEQLPQLLSVRFQLEQVIHDLVNNALEAMGSRPGDHWLTLRASHDIAQSQVLLEISDNGPGISADIGERLFNPGVSTKQGLGIGLWWSQTFMRATGGDLLLKSTTPGGGATFLLSIPCATRAGAPKRAAVGQRKEVDVLIVDDDHDWAATVADVVGTEGLSVVIANSRAQASSALDITRFKVAVLDMRLADQNPENKEGLELLEKIDATGLDTQVLLMSGFWEDRDLERARRSTRLVNVFVKQRFDMQEFRNSLRTALERVQVRASNATTVPHAHPSE